MPKKFWKREKPIIPPSEGFSSDLKTGCLWFFLLILFLIIGMPLLQVGAGILVFVFGIVVFVIGLALIGRIINIIKKIW